VANGVTNKLRQRLINYTDEEFGEWIRTASPKNVRFVNLDEVFHSGTKGWIIQQELQARSAKGHHWTLTPVLVIAFLTMIFAAIAAWPIGRDWIWPPPVAKKDVQSELVPLPQTVEAPSLSLALPTAARPSPAQAASSPFATPKSEPPRDEH
jgi:hypothetical protein